MHTLYAALYATGRGSYSLCAGGTGSDALRNIGARECAPNVGVAGGCARTQ